MAMAAVQVIVRRLLCPIVAATDNVAGINIACFVTNVADHVPEIVVAADPIGLAAAPGHFDRHNRLLHKNC